MTLLVSPTASWCCSADAICCNEMLLNFHGLFRSFLSLWTRAFRNQTNTSEKGFFIQSATRCWCWLAVIFSVELHHDRKPFTWCCGKLNTYKLGDKPFAEFMIWKHKNWWSIVPLSPASLQRRLECTAFIPLSTAPQVQFIIYSFLDCKPSTWKMFSFHCLPFRLLSTDIFFCTAQFFFVLQLFSITPTFWSSSSGVFVI